MKQKKSMTSIIISIIVSMLIVGCGKSNNINQGASNPFTNGNNGPNAPGAPINSNGNADFTTGSTVDLQIVSAARMSQFVQRPLNNPRNIKINLSLDNFGNDSFGGFARITYDDQNYHQVNSFSAGNNSDETRYNIWFKKDGKDVWHGFFEDEYGAIVVTINGGFNLGDGGSTGLVSGSVWFKNFKFTTAPNPSNGCLPGFGCPSTRCWFVEIGPYQCRSFLQGDKIVTTSSVEPTTGGYVKLGEFSGLNRAKAFNE